MSDKSQIILTVHFGGYRKEYQDWLMIYQLSGQKLFICGQELMYKKHASRIRHNFNSNQPNLYPKKLRKQTKTAHFSLILTRGYFKPSEH